MSSNTEKLLADLGKTKKKTDIEEFDDEEGEEMADLLCCCACCTPQYYKEYFEITHQDIAQRMKMALLHDSRFHSVASLQPDLYYVLFDQRYGPFWLQTTLIFILIVGTVLNEHQKTESSKLTGKIITNEETFAFLPHACILIYGFGWGQPAIIYVYMRIQGLPVTLAPLVCSYGYSFSCFFLVTLVCFIPYQVIHILAMIYGAVSSYTFLYKNYANSICMTMNPGQKTLIQLIVFVIQFTFVVLYKIFFFDAIGSA